MFQVIGMIVVAFGSWGLGVALVCAIQVFRKKDMGVGLTLIGVLTAASLFTIFNGVRLFLLKV